MAVGILDFSEYLILLVLLKSPILIFMYFKWNTIKKHLIPIRYVLQSKISFLKLEKN